jgi:hypothetical protein
LDARLRAGREKRKLRYVAQKNGNKSRKVVVVVERREIGSKRKEMIFLVLNNDDCKTIQ